MQLSLFGFEPTLNVVRSSIQKPVTAYEYFLLISPGFKIKEQVKELKEKLDAKIGISKENLHSVPHISLMLFREERECDNYIIEKTNEALAGFSDLNILLTGANTFDHTYTRDLILRVECPELQPLHKSLCSKLHLKAGNFEPHLTIARGIPKNRFEKLGASFHDFDLRADFHCSHVTILKREVEVSSKAIKRSVYTKIYKAPLSSGIVQRTA